MAILRAHLLRFGLVALTVLGWPAAAVAGSLVNEVAHSLIARAEPVTWVDGHRTGSAWKSPDASSYWIGRGRGAAGIGMALLAAYDTTGDAGYLSASGAAGDFLVAAQVPAGSGRWPVAYNPSGPAENASTSFEDGAPGIADFLWQLYERTGNARYASAALAGMDWEISEAEAPNGLTCPPVCVWPQQDVGPGNVDNGMGHGIAGIALAFNAFAQRRAGVDPARSTRYAAYARAAGAALESQMVRTKLPRGGIVARIPEKPGARVFAAGFESGSAGDAFLFYQLYLTTGRAQYRRDADLLMAGVRADAVTDGNCAGVTWAADSGRGKSLRVTGIERGNAGIGWVALQAYKLLITRDPSLAIRDLELARAAGDWLLSPCAVQSRDGKMQWATDSSGRVVSPSLGNGAAGIGIFLYDLYNATGSPSYSEGAAEARKWIASAALRNRDDVHWCGAFRAGAWQSCGEPSWSRGEAGILDMAARLDGWSLDTPGVAPGFEHRR
ncbi:MAG: lanthionine synthetase LanC family protein [Rhizomicrobium sp.]